jgi:predicted nucleotidyltransferase
MRREELLKRLKELRPLLTQKGIERLRVFGSHARDDAQANSDVDLVARFSTQPSFVDLIAIEQEIGKALGVGVDLATEAGLRPRVRARIEAEAIDA